MLSATCLVPVLDGRVKLVRGGGGGGGGSPNCPRRYGAVSAQKKQTFPGRYCK